MQDWYIRPLLTAEPTLLGVPFATSGTLEEVLAEARAEIGKPFVAINWISPVSLGRVDKVVVYDEADAVVAVIYDED